MQRMAPQPQPQPQPQDAIIDKNYEVVRRQGAKVYAETTDPAEAKEWLRNTKRVLDRIKCISEQKLRYDVSLFEKKALDWWETVPGRKNRPITLTWNDFLKEFVDKYTLLVYRNCKKVEFLELKQNELSVAGYDLQFVRLSKYVSEEVSTDELKRDGFEGGLRLEIWEKIAIKPPSLGEDKVQPDHSVEDLFPLVLFVVGDILENVGEPSQLCAIVAVNQDILSGIVLHGEIMPRNLRLQGKAVWEKIHNELVRIEDEVEVVEVVEYFNGINRAK
ncbi:UNVERIFIED_CONTAM: hypothetical protein Sangu_1021100 [Sesamum angustifolium]|uniref:Retrotransposon gag domain-containing protein n=1 Tax=Sesamum angustifolium TaxID=2727405 RepID=A0AAW2NYQ6_9LAMI